MSKNRGQSDSRKDKRMASKSFRKVSNGKGSRVVILRLPRVNKKGSVVMTFTKMKPVQQYLEGKMIVHW